MKTLIVNDRINICTQDCHQRLDQTGNFPWSLYKHKPQLEKQNKNRTILGLPGCSNVSALQFMTGLI